jgi:hypothetical protein
MNMKRYKVVGRMMVPKDVYILLPGSCECARISGKEELRLQVET